MRIPDQLLVHTVTVHPKLGASSTGTLYGDPVQLRCMAQGGRRLVRASDGTEQLSTLTLYAAPGEADKLPVGSLVEWRGDTTTVLASVEHDDGGMGAPQHAEVSCE